MVAGPGAVVTCRVVTQGCEWRWQLPFASFPLPSERGGVVASPGVVQGTAGIFIILDF